MTQPIIITVVIIVNALCSIVARWFSTHRKMKPFYMLDALAGFFMIIGNTLIFMQDLHDYAPLAYYVLGGWQIGFGVWGLCRESK